MLVALVVVLVGLGGGGVEVGWSGVEVEHLPRGSTQSMLMAPESREFCSILGTKLRVISGSTWMRNMGALQHLGQQIKI